MTAIVGSGIRQNSVTASHRKSGDFRYGTLSCAVMAGMALLVNSTSAVEPPELKKFGWHTDYATAKAEAKRSGKPLMVVFRCEP